MKNLFATRPEATASGLTGAATVEGGPIAPSEEGTRDIGTGKSTLLKLLLATLRPDSGSVPVYGQDVTRLSRHQLNQLRTRIGMVYQSSALISPLSVRDNLALALEEFTDSLQSAPKSRPPPRFA